MEGLAVMILMIALIVRTIKKHKKSIKASQEKYRPQDAMPPMGEGMSAYPPQDVPKRQPVQQKINLDAPTHRHVEHVPVQAGAFAGEGDADRYNTREVSCQTVGHETQVPQYNLPAFDRKNMVSAIIMSEVLGKPKAHRR